MLHHDGVSVTVDRGIDLPFYLSAKETSRARKAVDWLLLPAGGEILFQPNLDKSCCR